MRRALVVVGTGGHGREVADAVLAAGHARSHDLLGFLDDAVGPWPLVERLGLPVLGPTEALRELDVEYVIGIGDGDVRRRLAELAGLCGRRAAVVIHPTASFGRDVEMAPGVVLAAGSRITTHVHLGAHAQVNVNASISHDCVVAPYATVSPGATICGNVRLGEGVLVGAGATILPGLSIGDWSTIGAGAVVVGSPARQLVAR
jgi:sugar O-acyltransferase (sialic acid O-acetyltransferase NeuD family)